MQEQKTDEIVNQITNYVNTFSRREEFNEAMSREHRTLQQSFTRLCLKWLEHIAQEGYRTDLRNEASKKIANELVSNFKEKNGFAPSEFLPFV
jgi:predicted sulfurtransferase